MKEELLCKMVAVKENFEVKEISVFGDVNVNNMNPLDSMLHLTIS